MSKQTSDNTASEVIKLRESIEKRNSSVDRRILIVVLSLIIYLVIVAINIKTNYSEIFDWFQNSPAILGCGISAWQVVIGITHNWVARLIWGDIPYNACLLTEMMIRDGRLPSKNFLCGCISCGTCPSGGCVCSPPTTPPAVCTMGAQALSAFAQTTDPGEPGDNPAPPSAAIFYSSKNPFYIAPNGNDPGYSVIPWKSGLCQDLISGTPETQANAKEAFALITSRGIFEYARDIAGNSNSDAFSIYTYLFVERKVLPDKGKNCSNNGWQIASDIGGGALGGITTMAFLGGAFPWSLAFPLIGAGMGVVQNYARNQASGCPGVFG